MKKLVDFNIEENIAVGAGCFLLKLHTDEQLPEILPGQFVNVMIEDAGVLLRRPISIHYADAKKGILELLVKIAGKGTEKLSHIAKRENINILIPLGMEFTMPAKEDNVLLVGGGVGIAPLYYFAKVMCDNGIKPTLLIGTRSAGDIILKEKFSQVADLYYTTEDGSYGEKGYPTQHSVLLNNFDKIYTCGPTPMMKGIAAYANKKGIFCEVSLENKMACGIGACLCCVQDTKEGHKCVCTTGPVFNINDLKWQN